MVEEYLEFQSKDFQRTSWHTSLIRMSWLRENWPQMTGAAGSVGKLATSWRTVPWGEKWGGGETRKIPQTKGTQRAKKKKQRGQRNSEQVHRKGSVSKRRQGCTVHSCQSQANEGSCWPGPGETCQDTSRKVEETGWQRLKRKALFHLWKRGTH